MDFNDLALKNVAEALFKGEDHRGVVLNAINSAFLDDAMNFFKKVLLSKVENKIIDNDWYKENFLSSDLPKNEIAWNSGINVKSISNTYKSTKRSVIIDASQRSYESLVELINELTQIEDTIDLNLTIKYNSASVELTLNESLIVINALAVRRSAIRGGGWSSIGKTMEKPLMKSLALLYGVPPENYDEKYKRIDLKASKNEYSREIDFYFISRNGKRYNCEVKLMGKGNPEVADAVIARGTNIFIADTLSETNRRQLTHSNIQWVELGKENGFRKFSEILSLLDIPHITDPEISDEIIEKVIEQSFL